MADGDRSSGRPQGDDRTTGGEPGGAPAHESTLDQTRRTLSEAEDRLHEMYERLREIESRYDQQTYKADYAAWQLESALARRWWRVGEAVFRVKRRPSLVLRLPADLLRAARKADMPKPPRRPEAKRAAAVPDLAAQSDDDRTATPQAPHVPQIPLPGGPVARPELTVAAIVDEFSALALRYEWRQVEPALDDWREVMERARPDLLFVASARLGDDERWAAHVTEAPGRELRDLVEWCRGRHIPSVFWHTQDADLSVETAKLFDHVFTTRAESVSRYRELLGHDRVEVLPFAAQPRIHNPVKVSSGRRHDVAFAGTYLGDGRPERAEQMRTVLEPARGSGLHIYSRPPEGAPRHRFPAEYDRHVVGSLPYERMLAAYRAYKVFLNVNSTPDSPTLCARRVFELSACGTPVLSGPSRAIEEFFAGSVPITRTAEDTRTLLVSMLANPEVRDRQAHLAMREVFARHTFGHRVDTVLDAIGRSLPRAEPYVSVIMVTNRPAQLPHAIAQVAGQRWRRLQLVLVLHGLDLDPDVVRGKAAAAGIGDVVVLTADASLPLGQCLNIAIDGADGDLIAKMDDDDIYGEHYLSDLVPAFSYTDADIVGKRACYVRLLGMNATLLSSPEAEHTYNDLVRGGTLVVRGDVLRRLRFDHVPRGSDTKLLRRAEEAGVRIYSGDRFNYIYIRNSDPSAHTWQVSDAALLKSAQVVFFGPPEEHVCV